MAILLKNVPNGSAVARVVANTTIQPSDLNFSNSSISENVQSFVVSRLMWTTSNNITIARGANTILTLYNNGDWNFDYGAEFNLNEFPAANLVITINTGGSLLVKMNKTSYTAS